MRTRRRKKNSHRIYWRSSPHLRDACMAWDPANKSNYWRVQSVSSKKRTDGDGQDANALVSHPLARCDASRIAINAILSELWSHLDHFATDRSGPAWKQVEQHLLHTSGHGSRQVRCEMEQAGRLLRAQATRKQVFLVILPLLSEGLIRPAEGTRPAKKDYPAIKEQVRALRADVEDADAFMALTNVVEQACNRYLETGVFPTTYEDMQAVPVQEVAQLTFAGDDGMNAGQTYRTRLSVAQFCDVQTRQEQKQASLWLKLRAPETSGRWAWGEWSQEIPLPETVFQYLDQGASTQAPTLREIRSDDGRQARLRREIDRLKACRDRYVLLVKQAVKAQTEQKTPLPPHFAGWQEQITSYNTRIKTCWKKYERRNRELAHLASNLLILLALLHD